MKVLLKRKSEELTVFRALRISAGTWFCTNVLGTLLLAIVYGPESGFLWVFLLGAVIFTSPTTLVAIPAIYFLDGIIDRNIRMVCAFAFILVVCWLVMLVIAALFNSISMLVDLLPLLAAFVAAAEVSFFAIAARVILKETKHAEAL